MRILLASGVANNVWTGMGKWSHRVAEGLRQRGHDTTLWFADDFPRLRRGGRLSVLLFPVALAARLWKCRSQFDAVVIHEPSGYWYGQLRRLLPSLPPMVAVCHNVESHHFRRMLGASRRGFASVPLGMRVKAPLFRHWQSDGAIRKADHVICSSTVDREYIIARLGRCPEAVTQLASGAEEQDFVSRAYAPLGRRVLFVGGWLDVKGRRLLPPLWSQVRRVYPDARLTAVGTGAPPSTVLADFSPADRDSVTVPPRLEAAQMRAQYAAHDLFLMPSLSEGSPLSLLEAMAAGLPVVAARVGGVPDIVTDEQDGLLFEPLDAAGGAAQVCRVLGDAGLASRLGRDGQSRARSLSWSASSLAVEKAVQAALMRPRRGRRGAGAPAVGQEGLPGVGRT